MYNKLKNSSERDIITSEDLEQQISLLQQQYAMIHEREQFLYPYIDGIWQGTGSDRRFKIHVYDTKGQRKTLAASTKEVLESKIIDFYKAKIQYDRSLQDTFEEWINWKVTQDGLDLRTKSRYESDYRRFFKPEERITQIPFREITEDQLEEFIRLTIVDNRLSAKAWSKLRLILNGVFKYGKKKGYTDITISVFMANLDLSKRIFTQKIVEDSDQVFTPNEEKIIISWIDENPSLINYGIKLLFLTGLRVGELSALSYDDIKGHELRVRKQESFKAMIDENGKEVLDNNGNKRKEYYIKLPKTNAGIRTVLITDEAIETLEVLKRFSQPNPDNYIFFENDHRVHAYQFSQKLYKWICKHVGIKSRSAHKVRKTYSTKLINAGVKPKNIISQLGHTDFSTTEKFYYFNNETKQQIYSEIESALKV